MEVFKNINDAPYPPSKIPFKATRLRLMDHHVVREHLKRKPTSPLLCTVCPQPGLLICSGCHATRYCTVECQKTDRSTHKFFCKSFDSFKDDKRPSPFHIRAILFPEDKNKPAWTWVLKNDDSTAVSLSHLYENLPSDGLTEVNSVTYVNCQSTRMPPHWTTHIARFQTSRGEHSSSINKSILNLGPPGHLPTYWGPVLVIAGKPESPTPGDDYPDDKLLRVEDVEMTDVWPIMEVMLYGGRECPCVVNLPRYPHRSLPGIKINCYGDRVRFHPDKDPYSDAATYESVTVPNRENMKPPRHTRQLCFSCLAYRGRPTISSMDFWDPRGEPDPLLLSNRALGGLHAKLKQHGSHLKMAIEAGLPRPHVSPTQPYNIEEVQPPGTVILVHAFGEPIRTEHLRVADLFIRQANVSCSWYVPGSGYKTFNRDVFRKFWGDKKAANDIPGVDLSGVPSPYAWMDKERDESKYVENFAEYESFLKEAVTDVFFDNVFRGGRASPLAGRTEEWAQELFDPLN